MLDEYHPLCGSGQRVFLFPNGFAMAKAKGAIPPDLLDSQVCWADRSRPQCQCGCSTACEGAWNHLRYRLRLELINIVREHMRENINLYSGRLHVWLACHC